MTYYWIPACAGMTTPVHTREGAKNAKCVNFHGLTPVALAEYELRSSAYGGATSSHALTRGALRR
ncbi:MAG: hypothetical protein Q8R30_02480 [bacterium]|nr:hypothetical protein [bacterium]MDZ4286208.1 hypothetical protein [Candidatus Sungbacteria bacterium]